MRETEEWEIEESETGMAKQEGARESGQGEKARAKGTPRESGMRRRTSEHIQLPRLTLKTVTD